MKTAIGRDIIIAKKKPCNPITSQSVINIKAICPAIAPNTIPKFNPIPSIIGINNESTTNRLRESLKIIS